MKFYKRCICYICIVPVCIMYIIYIIVHYIRTDILNIHTCPLSSG